FAVLGVGSGQNSGLDQIFSGLFGGGGSSISKAQHAVTKNPQSPKAYRDLATAYEAHGETAGAIGALQTYVTLKKKDAAAWAELGGLQISQAQQFAQAYQDAQTEAQLAAPSQAFLPTGTLGTAIGQNQIEQIAAQNANASLQTLYQQGTSDYSNAETSYKTVAKLQPHDANSQFQLATAAQDAGDYTTAVAALKKYLKLDPTSPEKAQVQSLIKQLSPAPAKPAKKKKSSK
ncbi:MAG TPA: tetratricopeptide repeat protein, partial [Gaiellaceae bacterium]|nr:tetratricopeptide repeat protein [Gaiellaceae bacterium]